MVKTDEKTREEIIAETVKKVRTNFLIGRTMRPVESVAVPIMFIYCKESAEFAIDLTEKATASEIFKAIEGQGPWHTDSDGWKQLKKKYGVY